MGLFVERDMTKESKGPRKAKNIGAPVRLYARGVFTGYRRARQSQRDGQALVHIENCSDKKGAAWYLGKRVAYVYKVKNKVMNTHGHGGTVRVSFKRNITPAAMGAMVRVMLY